MSLPIILSKGLVSIYNAKPVGALGITAPQNYNFGTLNQTWYNDAYPPYKGTSVMFDGRDVVTLIYAGSSYTIIEEDKIKLIEIASS